MACFWKELSLFKDYICSTASLDIHAGGYILDWVSECDHCKYVKENSVVTLTKHHPAQLVLECNLLSYFPHGNMNKRVHYQKLSFGVCRKDSTLCVSSFISFIH